MKQIKRAPGVVVTALGLLALALRGLMYLLAEDDRGLLRSHPLAWLLWALTACAALAAFRIGAQNLVLLSHLTESYLVTQLEQGFSSLDFYKSLYAEVT